MTKKIPTARKPKSYPYALLSAPISLQLMSSSGVGSTLGSFLKHNEWESFHTRLSALLEKKKINECLNHSASSLEEFGRQALFRTTPERLAVLYRLTITSSKQKLQRFFSFQESFENLFLLGKYDEASEILEACKMECGESLWLFRSKFLILASQGRFEELSNYATNLKLRAPNGFIKYLISLFMMLATDPLLHLERHVKNTIQELNSTQRSWADFFTLLFVPRPLLKGSQDLRCFAEFQIFPITDQALLLDRFVSEAIANSNLAEGDPFGFAPLLAELKSHDRSHQTAILENLVRAYEVEDRDALSRIELELENSGSNRIAAVGLLAKARSEQLLPSTRSDNPYDQAVRSLATIYNISPESARADIAIRRMLVACNHLSFGNQLQMCVMLAMPHHFEKSDREWLANIILSTSNPTTPLLQTARNADPILDHQYLEPEERLPEHRKIKHQIRSLEKKENQDTETLLGIYSALAPLARDYIELRTAIHLRNDDIGGLIRFSAKALIENQSTFTALPMTAMLDHLKRRTTKANLESLIVAFNYVRRIDPSKDNLANALFEDFLEENGAARPSELLECLEFADPAVRFFFRDICATDTMDYLGCFDSSNDLRAERLLILDRLLEEEAISDTEHREEVDEIIGQVVIDAGVAAFNISKIDVDTRAIKRKISEDVKSLITLYRSLQESDNGNAFLPISDDDTASEENSVRALVAGDKNTALLRLLSVIRDAFLFDEKFGLDKALSAEIRHGFFSNLMRSSLENEKLVTEADEKGVYKRNQYWCDLLSIVNDDVVYEIDRLLAWLAEEFDKLVASTEEWMKITTDSNPHRIFNFSIPLDDFVVFGRLARERNADAFIDAVTARLWIHTESCLGELRGKLSTQFANQIETLFNELELRVTAAKGNLPLANLMEAIYRAKGSARENVATVCQWFQRSQSQADSRWSIEGLLRIAIESFRRIRSIELSPVTNNLGSVGRFYLTGANAKSFTIALVNLLENCHRGSGFGSETTVWIDANSTDSGWQIQISNSLTESRVAEITPEFVEMLNTRMRSAQSLKLMRSEGGTGLSKVYHQLKMISSDFDVSVLRHKDRFNVRVRYANTALS